MAPPVNRRKLTSLLLDGYFRFPVVTDLAGGGLLALGGFWAQAWLVTRYARPFDLTNPTLVSFADQLCSASVSTAGFVFTALALFVSVGENYRAKMRDEVKQHPVAPRPADGFDVFFISQLYATSIRVFLWASVELFLSFGLLVAAKFLWSLLADWQCATLLLLAGALFSGGVFRSVYISYRIMTISRASPLD